MSWEDVTKLRISEQKYKQIPIYLLKIMHRKSRFQYAIIKTNASPEGAICLFSRVQVTKTDRSELRKKKKEEKIYTISSVFFRAYVSSTQSVRVTTFRVNN